MHVPRKEFERLWKIKPFASADAVVIRNGEVLLIKRATEPFRGMWCLPGGIMDTGETIEETALREVKEETGVTAKIIALVGVYSGPRRDPRGTTLSVCFLMEYAKGNGKGDDEVSDVRFFSPEKVPKKLGFDHAKMIRDALKVWKTESEIRG